MKPFEFLALTPKTNCGECGHPTCLAFSVAVTKGGEDSQKCAYIDTTSLPPEFRQAGEKSEPSAAQTDWALVDHLIEKMAGLDFESLASPLDAQWDESDKDVLIFNYLDHKVRLSKKRIIVDGRNIDDPRDAILLYNYVYYGGGEKGETTWVGLESLPNSISKVTTLATYCEKVLARRFSARAEVLSTICTTLGAQPPDSEQSASVAGIIRVLPRVPIYLLFWDEAGEEGFEATVKVLFEQRVLQYLDLESLVFTAERMAERIVELDTL